MKNLAVVLFLFLSKIVFAQDSVETGKASFYHDSFHGLETSNGETYNKNDFTAAHRTMPFGTILLVTNKKNKKSVIVRVNDRGPFKKSRVLDLSFAAATKIGMVPFGVVQVRIVPLTWLDSSTIDDNFFHDGEVWDCYAKKQGSFSKAIYLWQSENWKHAFYMASSLSLEKNVDVFVKVEGRGDKKMYSLIVEEDEKAEEVKGIFRKEGFRVRSVKN